VHTVQGDLDAALRDHLRLAELNPAWSGGQELQLLYGLEPAVFAPYWDELDAICAGAVRRKLRAQPRYLGFRALACLYRKDPDPELALKLAEQATREAGEQGTGGLAEALHYLGEVRFGRGEIPEAIRTLERAARLHRTWSKSARDLRECCSRYFPRLASCASVDAYLQGELLEGEEPLAHLPQVRASMASESPAIGAYLEACLLERDGRIDEAMRRLEPLALADAGAAPELVLRLAEWQARSGDAGAALRRIEERFATTAESSPWVAWMRIASAGDLAIPALVERVGSFPAEKPGFRIVASDVRWLLRCLHQDGVVRLHCGGGGEYTDVHGHRWGRDRFFEGGEGYGNARPRLKIQEDLDLYYDHRRFRAGATARNAYRIPLPRGRYDVTLHLCATDPRPEPRRFQLAVEGEKVGQALDLVKDPGVGALRLERIEVEVAAGALDLLFEPLPGCYAVVNAIEVAALPRK
jgi:tetratricopeptide (TPR) repeat protein